MRAIALVLCLLAAGCVAPDPAPASTPSPQARFEALPPEPVEVEGAAGDVLRGYLWRPVVPEGQRVPVVLASTPYTTDPSWVDEGAIPRKELVEAGFAVAAFDLRGTGRSDGCFEWMGPNEQRDQVLLVEWAAAQPWSNGRVGMIGVSYLAATAIMAAIEQPSALRTIVVSGLVTDGYTFIHSPQGAAVGFAPGFLAQFATSVGVEERTRAAGPLTEMACPDLARPSVIVEVGIRTDERDAEFWDSRRFIDRFPQINAAVLVTHGFRDLWGSGHAKQEDAVWEALQNAPKWMFEGQWGHGFPINNRESHGFEVVDWNERLIAWLAYWLRDEGPAPARLGFVDYMDSEGRWRESTSWPPAEARPEALALSAGKLGGEPRGEPTRFRASPSDNWPTGLVCGAEASKGALFVSEPLAEDSLVAGNPYAVLRLRSDAKGGIFQLDLFDVGPEEDCGKGAWEPREIAAGAADLRFHAGNLRGRDFPTNAWTDVRVDLNNLADIIPAGHRLALLVSGGDGHLAGQPYEPMLEIAPESVMVVPFVEGSLGGAPSSAAHPPRPFTPAVAALAAFH